MSEPFLAQITIVGFNFAPRGYALCDGQLLPINQNQSLYSLLGTTYGGDGRTSFGLPDLRGRACMHVSDAHRQGQKSGEETVTLAAAQTPQHTHQVKASNQTPANSTPLGDAYWTITPGNTYKAPGGANAGEMKSSSVANAGGQAHDNMQPYLTINYCIALTGLFPSRN